MSSRHLQLGLILVLLLSLFITTNTGFAQTSSTVCTNIVNRTLTDMAVNCANRTTGTACYATDEVNSNLNPALDPQVFDEPGERVDLIDIIHVRPQALSLTDETWGITLLNMQASLPAEFAQDVVVVGLGGAEIENGVMLEDTFVATGAPISATTSVASELRAPTMNPAAAEVIEQVPNGSIVNADTISSDGQWVRVIFGSEAGWLPISAFGTAGISGLPVLDGFTSMQSFYLRTGIDGKPCVNAPSFAFVQGPRDTTIDLVINGVNIRLQSTILVRTINPGEPLGLQMEIIALYGLVVINPDTAAEIVIPAGYSLIVNLGSELVNLGIEGDNDERTVVSFNTPRLLTREEIAELIIVTLIPDNIINYPIELPEIIEASGVTGITRRIVFRDPRAIAVIQEWCEENRLPDAICEIFGF